MHDLCRTMNPDNERQRDNRLEVHLRRTLARLELERSDLLQQAHGAIREPQFGRVAGL